MTGFANSMDSKEFNLPFLITGESMEDGLGLPRLARQTLEPFGMVSAVLSMPFGESAAVFAAPLTSPAANCLWNSCAYKSSAPGRP